MSPSIDLTKLKLRLLAKPKILPRGLQSAFVLVTLSDDPSRILLTRRSTQLTSHAGEVCFPGGKPKANETFLFGNQTALRESYEEIGWPGPGAKLDFLGYLEAVPTVSSKFAVIGCVYFSPQMPQSSELVLNPKEVDSARIVEISEILDSRSTKNYRLGGKDLVLPTFDIARWHPIWGVTAVIIEKIITLITR